MRKQAARSPRSTVTTVGPSSRPAGRRATDHPFRTALALFTIALAFNIGAHAREDEAASRFQAGRIAFESQDYATALRMFEGAAQGLSGPAVHFNIGVTAYRLGNYARARTAFEEAARTPEMAAVAHYNLGLVSLAANDRDEAAQWFARAENEATEERLRGLASARLAELAQPVERRNWIAYGALAAGYDDNVALISNSDVLGVSGTEDTFVDLQLAVSAPLSGPWQLDAGLSWTDYQDLNSFDQMSLYGGSRYRFETQGWVSDIGLQLDYDTLDAEGFQRQQTLLLQTRTALVPGLHLRARYRFSSIDGLGGFDGLSGQRHEAGAQLRWDYNAWDLAAEYRFDTSDLDDDALSDTRHELGLNARRSLPGGWEMMLEIARAHSRYEIASQGTEDRTDFAVAMSKALGARWRLILRSDFADNDADRPEFDYQRVRISAGLEAVL